MKTCTSCDTEKPASAFKNRTGDSHGRPYKTCRECRDKQRIRQAERRKPHASRVLGRNKVAPKDTCADCGTGLTPNRTVVLDGCSLCYGCRGARFGITKETR